MLGYWGMRRRWWDTLDEGSFLVFYRLVMEEEWEWGVGTRAI